MTEIALALDERDIAFWARQCAASAESRVLVAATPAAAIAAEDMRIPCTLAHELPSLGESCEMLRQSTAIRRDWWRTVLLPDTAPGALDIEGIPVLALLEAYVFHVVAEGMMALFRASKLLERYRPRRILIREHPVVTSEGLWAGIRMNPFPEAVCILAAVRGIEVTRLSRNYPVQDLCRSVQNGLRTMYLRMRRTLFSDRIAIPSGLVWRSSDGPEKRRVLVWSEGGYGIPLIPFLKAIQMDPALDLIVLTADETRHCVRTYLKEGFRTYDCRIHGTPEMFRRVSDGHRALWRAWACCRGDKADERTCGVWPTGLWPLMRPWLDSIMKREMPDILRHIFLAKCAIQHIRPHVILTPIDMAVRALAWTLVGRNEGVPSVSIDHGALVSIPYPGHIPIDTTDKIAVWSPVLQEWHTQVSGRSREDIVCVGHPQHESHIAEYRAIDPAWLYGRLGLTRDRPVILFLVNMMGGNGAPCYGSLFHVYKEFLAAMDALPEAQVIIRTHPGMDWRLARAIAPRWGRRCLVNPSAELLALLKITDVVVGHPTTATLDAMLVKRPVVLYHHLISEFATWWVEHGDLRTASDATTLAAVVRSLLDDPEERGRCLKDQESFLVKYLGPLDGASTHRMVRLIHEVTLGKPRLSGGLRSGGAWGVPVTNHSTGAFLP